MTQWIDLTIRPEGAPEIAVNPATGEVELSWTITDADGGRVTLLVARKAAEALVETVKGVLA